MEVIMRCFFWIRRLAPLHGSVIAVDYLLPPITVFMENVDIVTFSYVDNGPMLY